AANQRTGTARSQSFPGASRGYVVTGVGGSTANMLRFAVVVPATAEYAVAVYYVAEGGHPLVIGVNGAAGTAYAFADTAGAVGRHTVRLRLRAGVNTIEFGHPRSAAPRIDRITIRLR
ncbi:MAG TPA: CBM35 domain-containing protein, partial [Pilimelia sp.]|nr:CBM35 domain-containing protein [Pilimelia sp.]